MGQGNIKYRKVKRTPQTGENAGKELWYATVVTDREMNFEEFVDHISSHNSPYSRGTVHGVMMDMLDCLKELILDGKSVRLGDLGLFSIGMSSRGEVSRDKVTSASVQDIHLGTNDDLIQLHLAELREASAVIRFAREGHDRLYLIQIQHQSLLIRVSRSLLTCNTALGTHFL